MLNSSGGLAGKQDDLASVTHAQSGGDALLELKQDALRCDEVEQPFRGVSHLATETARKRGKLQALSLRDIEDYTERKPTKTDWF